MPLWGEQEREWWQAVKQLPGQTPQILKEWAQGILAFIGGSIALWILIGIAVLAVMLIRFLTGYT